MGPFLKYPDTIQKQGKFFPPYFGVGPDWFCWFFCYNFPANFLSWLIIILQQNSATLSHESKHTRTEIAPLTRPVEAQQIVPPSRIGPDFHKYCLSKSYFVLYEVRAIIPPFPKSIWGNWKQMMQRLRVSIFMNIHITCKEYVEKVWKHHISA